MPHPKYWHFLAQTLRRFACDLNSSWQGGKAWREHCLIRGEAGPKAYLAVSPDGEGFVERNERAESYDDENALNHDFSDQEKLDQFRQLLCPPALAACRRKLIFVIEQLAKEAGNTPFCSSHTVVLRGVRSKISEAP